MVLYSNIVFFIGRKGHSSVVLNDGSILVLGGQANVGGYASNEVWKSSDDGVTWDRLTTAAWGDDNKVLANGRKYFLIVYHVNLSS